MAVEAIKLVSLTGTTRNGFRVPIVHEGDPPQIVEADLPEGEQFSDADRLCPQFEGDGVCVGKTVGCACSGGLSVGSSIALRVTYEPGDVLAQDDTKVRVKRYTVHSMFDLLADIRNGNISDLQGAFLRGVDLWGVNLEGVNLRDANLEGANLQGVVWDESTVWPKGFTPPEQPAR